MQVLLTNDDGVHAEGMWALYRRFYKRHAVTVVAPDRERSAVGHAITLEEPLRAARVEVNGGYQGYAVSGTPVDCIKFAVLELFDTKPDLVIAGINPGANVGVNLNYSGTVAAAREAALYGIAAMAVSIEGHAVNDYGDAAQFVQSLAEKVLEKGLPFGTFLNVNIPGGAFAKTAGIRFSQQGLELYPEYLEKRTDPRNRIYYWQGCDSPYTGENPDVDGTALSKNYISITPIKCDMTDYKLLEDLKNWQF
ncbi:MAG: 5'/3'-nucleotidase SurE [Desulfobacterales bacterium]|jgi:5'-nucleotidase